MNKKSLRMVARGLLFAGLIGGSSISHAGLFSDNEARARVDALTQENQTLRAQQANLAQQLQALKAQLATLSEQSGAAEKSDQAAIKELQLRQRDIYADTDSRLRTLESKAATQATGSDGNLAKENSTYQAGFSQIRAGNYKAGIKTLEEFVAAYPQSAKAASALYWIGNAQYGLRDYASAIQAQQRLVKDYGSSPLVPDAMLNLANSQIAAGSKDDARQTLNDLISRYPTSLAATQAKARIKHIGS